MLDNWQFIVSLEKLSRRPVSYEKICGGVIINQYQVLTAGHCLEKTKKYVWLGLELETIT